MPLFFIISGFCMNKLLCREEISIKEELLKRCKRLVIPYLFYSYIAIIPKLLFNSFMYLPFDKNQLWEIFLGKSPSGTLWYIWNLFVINLFFILLCRLTQCKCIWLLVSLGMYTAYLCNIGCYFSNLLKYPIFFMVGIYLAMYRKYIFNFLKNKGIVAYVLLIFVAIIVFSIEDRTYIGFITAICGSIAMLYFAISITDKRGRLFNLLKTSSDFSYGIYLMSPYVLVAIRVFLYKALGMPYLLCMSLMLILGFAIPYVFIKCIVKKNKVLRLVLIGETA